MCFNAVLYAGAFALGSDKSFLRPANRWCGAGNWLSTSVVAFAGFQLLSACNCLWVAAQTAACGPPAARSLQAVGCSMLTAARATSQVEPLVGASRVLVHWRGFCCRRGRLAVTVDNFKSAASTMSCVLPASLGHAECCKETRIRLHANLFTPIYTEHQAMEK